MANITKLLKGAPNGADFLSQLDPTSNEVALLEDAKSKIRRHLREAFAQATRALGQSVTPRFYTQGSRAYKTLNRPAHPPAQQMDLDDGCYLPMSFLRNGTPRPSQAADAFFQVADTALKQLADREGWKFIPKPTCCRLEISDNAHVDVPLYAIPDHQFQTLAKAAAARGLLLEDTQLSFMEAYGQLEDHWALLPPDSVLLAHRERDWIASDPRKIHVWFVGAVETYGEQFRRECRYLKAWRDHHRLKTVSSLVLMTCSFVVYNEIHKGWMPNRDDEALLKVMTALPDLLAKEVYNPAESPGQERLDDRITDEDRRRAIQLAADSATSLNAILLHSYSADRAVERAREIFGPRVPLRPDLVGIERPALEVASTPAIITPAPDVKRAKSG